MLLLHRPEFYDPNDSPGVAEAFVAKNRNGRQGSTIRFHVRRPLPAIRRWTVLSERNRPAKRSASVESMGTPKRIGRPRR